MKFRVEIDVDNDAFFMGDEHDPGPEVSRILFKLAKAIYNEGTAADLKLRDVNGNTVGRAKYTRR